MRETNIHSVVPCSLDTELMMMLRKDTFLIDNDWSGLQCIAILFNINYSKSIQIYGLIMSDVFGRLCEVSLGRLNELPLRDS